MYKRYCDYCGAELDKEYYEVQLHKQPSSWIYFRETNHACYDCAKSGKIIVEEKT